MRGPRRTSVSFSLQTLVESAEENERNHGNSRWERPEFDISHVLPRPETFRQSGFMPHLSARFSLLREFGPIDQDSALERLEGLPQAGARVSKLGRFQKDSIEISRRATRHHLPLVEEQPRSTRVEKVSSQDNLERSFSILALCKEAETERLSPWRLVLTVAALGLVFLLIALDRTIIPTAVPHITDDFLSLIDVGWYGSAYLATESAALLLFHRLYSLYSAKPVICVAIAIFLAGSGLSGAAPTSKILIVGRAVAGIGAAGIFSGIMALTTQISVLRRKAVLQAALGAIYSIASICGPLLSGIFAERLTWRFCFYINIPIGLYAFLTLLCVLKPTRPNAEATKSAEPRYLITSGGGAPVAQGKSRPGTMQKYHQRLMELDLFGSAFFLGSIFCLLAALHLCQSPTRNPSLRAGLFIAFGILLAAFLAVQKTIPLRLLQRRSVSAGMSTQFFLGASMFSTLYYLPIWFQAIKSADPFHSGIMLLPLLISMVVIGILSSFLVPKMGFYMPSLLIGTVLMATGMAFMTTFTPAGRFRETVGFTLVYGLGLGMVLQQTTRAIQNVLLTQEDIALGVTLLQWSQQTGGAVFVSACQTVFARDIVEGVESKSIPGLDAASVLKSGATKVLGLTPVDYHEDLIEAYNGALTKVFQLTLIVSCFALLSTFLMEWVNPKKPSKAVGKGEEQKIPFQQ